MRDFPGGASDRLVAPESAGPRFENVKRMAPGESTSKVPPADRTGGPTAAFLDSSAATSVASVGEDPWEAEVRRTDDLESPDGEPEEPGAIDRFMQGLIDSGLEEVGWWIAGVIAESQLPGAGMKFITEIRTLHRVIRTIAALDHATGSTSRCLSGRSRIFRSRFRWMPRTPMRRTLGSSTLPRREACPWTVHRGLPYRRSARPSRGRPDAGMVSGVSTRRDIRRSPPASSASRMPVRARRLGR